MTNPAHGLGLRGPITPASTAHIAVHVQKIHLHTSILGRAFSAASRYKDRISRRIGMLANDARTAGIENIWIRFETQVDARGALALEPAQNELVISHNSYNPYYRHEGGNTALESHMQAKGIDTVIVSGAYLHYCVLSMVNTAREKGLRVIVPKDAVAIGTKAMKTEKGALWPYFEMMANGAELVSADDLAQAMVPHHTPRPKWSGRETALYSRLAGKPILPY